MSNNALFGFFTDLIEAFSLDVWAGAFLGVLVSALFAAALACLNSLRDLFPLRRLLAGFLEQDENCAIFIRWMRSPDRSNPNYYEAQLPDCFPPATSGKVSRHPNIPAVIAKADMQAAADVMNVLGRSGKTRNIEFLSIVDHYRTWDRNIVCIGGSAKTIEIFAQDDPENRSKRQFPENLGSLFPDLRLDTEDPCDDVGLIHKTFFQSTGKPCLVLMGGGVLGTEAAGYFFRNHARLLGKMYGKKPFSVLVTASLSAGPQSANLAWYYPDPSPWTRIFYPLEWIRRIRHVKQAQRG